MTQRQHLDPRPARQRGPVAFCTKDFAPPTNGSSKPLCGRRATKPVDHFPQTRLQSQSAGLAIDSSRLKNAVSRWSSLAGPLSLILSLSFVFSLGACAMNSLQIKKHRLAPASYWFLIALDALGPSKIVDLAAEGVFSLHAIHEGARAALELGLCEKSGTTWALLPEKQQTTPERPPEKQQTNRETTNEKRQIDDFSKISSRELKAVEVKPLLENSFKNSSVVFPSKSDDVKGEKKSENGEGGLLNEYAEKVLKLAPGIIRNLERLAEGKPAGRLVEVLDAYRWKHVEGGGEPVKNPVAWMSAAIHNGVNHATPRPWTFAAWAADRDYARRVAADQFTAEAERVREREQRQREQAAITPEARADLDRRRKAWEAEGNDHKDPGCYADPKARAEYRAWLRDWVARSPS